MDNLKLYVVMNNEGKYMRAKGYNGTGEKWIDDINSARFYPKIGTAKAQVTYWARNYPDYGIPVIVEIICTEHKIINQDERVSKRVTEIENRNNRIDLQIAEHRLKIEKERYAKEMKKYLEVINARHIK